MKSAQILREKINSRRPTIGILITFHFWFDLIEISRNAGLDYVIIDFEHMHPDEELVANACSLARMIDFPVIIRPPESNYNTVRLAADLGPCGFLLPQVRSTATMDDVRDALYMPPRGRRRPGGPGNRWMKGFNYADWKRDQEDHWIVLPQIESREGLANADAIARHEITTAIAVGPYDLSAELGVCWNPADPIHMNAIDTIRKAGESVGKNMWMIGDGATLTQRGFTFLCITEPSLFLENALKSAVGTLRSLPGNGASAAGSKGDKPLP